jgi:hypothetical protein
MCPARALTRNWLFCDGVAAAIFVGPLTKRTLFLECLKGLVLAGAPIYRIAQSGTVAHVTEARKAANWPFRCLKHDPIGFRARGSAWPSARRKVACWLSRVAPELTMPTCRQRQTASFIVQYFVYEGSLRKGREASAGFVNYYNDGRFTRTMGAGRREWRRLRKCGRGQKRTCGR